MARVAVAIGREVGARDCRYLRANGRWSRTRSCHRTIYLKARGTERWALTLRRAFPVGRYKVWVRGTDAAGNVERKDQTHNFLRLRVR